MGNKNTSEGCAQEESTFTDQEAVVRPRRMGYQVVRFDWGPVGDLLRVSGRGREDAVHAALLARVTVFVRWCWGDVCAAQKTRGQSERTWDAA